MVRAWSWDQKDLEMKPFLRADVLYIYIYISVYFRCPFFLSNFNVFESTIDLKTALYIQRSVFFVGLCKAVMKSMVSPMSMAFWN